MSIRKLQRVAFITWVGTCLHFHSRLVSGQDVPQLNGRHFRITALQEHGFLDIQDDDNDGIEGNIRYSGYLIDMLAALSIPERGNFTYTLLPPSGHGSLCAPRLDTTSTGDEQASTTATETGISPYDARYRTQYNCGASDVNDLPAKTDMYLGMFYVTPARQRQNQFSLPFAPPFSGTLAMFGTATGIASFEDLVEMQARGQQPAACAPAGTALIDFIPAAYPGMQVKGLFGGEEEILQALREGTCTVYITDGPIAAQFVLRRSRRNECIANGMPIGVIGNPMDFGLSHYAIGIRRDLDPLVEHTLSYWINVLMSCNPLDPSGGCTDGNLASFYRGRGGDGTECGYVLFPTTQESLSGPAIAAIVVASVVLVIIVSTCWHRYRLARQRRHFLRRQKEALAMAKREQELNEYIAHEIRNPLSSAIAALSFVSIRATDPEVVPLDTDRSGFEDDLRIADNSLQFVNDLLRNMLDVHRTSNKAMKLKMGPTDVLKDVLEPVVSIICMRGASASVEAVCEPSDLVVLSDKMRLKQICLNLAANASKFVETGFIRLSAHVEHSDEEGAGKNVVIHVEDSGPGIPASKRPKLFQKFQESLDVLNQGTGIGLSVCKNLSELMEADLYLDESFDSGIPGCVGTRFVLRLNQAPLDLESGRGSSRRLNEEGQLSPDLHVNASIPSIPSGTVSKELPPTLSILFVDDDTILRTMFCRTIRRIAPPGWDITQASDAESAIRLVDYGQRFDIIFMDHYIAGHSKHLLGTEAIRILRSRHVDSIICGLSANDKELEFLQSGADAFWLKPFPCQNEALSFAFVQLLNLRRVIGSEESTELETDVVEEAPLPSRNNRAR